MKFRKIFALPFIILLTATTITSCSTLQAQMNRPTPTIELTATPIFLPTQLSLHERVELQACMVNELVTIQSDKPQGDLISWAPEGHRLALVQPVNQYSGWYIGTLSIYDVDLQKTTFISKDTSVLGDLTWSPDGSRLAVVLLDQDAGIYTIRMISLADASEVDLFGDSARTDDFASRKGILGWFTETNLLVSSVCGSDCVRHFQYNSVSQVLNPQDDIRFNDDTSLSMNNETLSPDGKWMINTDDNDNLWLTSTQQNTVSLVLASTEVLEEKFSKDSKYLALRTADKVLIYQLGCTPKLP